MISARERRCENGKHRDADKECFHGTRPRKAKTNLDQSLNTESSIASPSRMPARRCKLYHFSVKKPGAAPSSSRREMARTDPSAMQNCTTPACRLLKFHW